MKFGVVGSAGTGKTGLARDISSKFNIPLLRSKVITRSILERDGYKWDSGISVEKFLAGNNCQTEMFLKTVEMELDRDSFVTDRTSIDFAAYAIAELGEVYEVNKIVEMCKNHVKKYTHLIFCPHGLVPLVDNNMRTLDPWYQFTIHSIMLSLLKEWDLNYYIIKTTDEKRILEVNEFLSS